MSPLPHDGEARTRPPGVLRFCAVHLFNLENFYIWRLPLQQNSFICEPCNVQIPGVQAHVSYTLHITQKTAFLYNA